MKRSRENKLIVKPVPVPASSHHPPPPGGDVLPKHEFT